MRRSRSVRNVGAGLEVEVADDAGAGGAVSEDVGTGGDGEVCAEEEVGLAGGDSDDVEGALGRRSGRG